MRNKAFFLEKILRAQSFLIQLVKDGSQILKNPLPEARPIRAVSCHGKRASPGLARPRQAHLKWLFWTCFDPNATSYSRPAGLRLAWLTKAESNQASPTKKKKKKKGKERQPWSTGWSPGLCRLQSLLGKLRERKRRQITWTLNTPQTVLTLTKTYFWQSRHIRPGHRFFNNLW